MAQSPTTVLPFENEKAVAMHRRARDVSKRVMGADSPNTLRIDRNFGFPPLHMNNYEETEAMYKRALRGQEEVLDRTIGILSLA